MHKNAEQYYNIFLELKKKNIKRDKNCRLSFTFSIFKQASIQRYLAQDHSLDVPGIPNNASVPVGIPLKRGTLGARR